MAPQKQIRARSRWLGLVCLVLLSLGLTLQAVHVHSHELLGESSSGPQHCALCALSHAPVTPAAIPVIAPQVEAQVLHLPVIQTAAPFQPRIAHFSRPPPLS